MEIKQRLKRTICFCQTIEEASGCRWTYPGKELDEAKA
jgi:hypothetical protein